MPKTPSPPENEEEEYLQLVEGIIHKPRTPSPPRPATVKSMVRQKTPSPRKKTPSPRKKTPSPRKKTPSPPRGTMELERPLPTSEDYLEVVTSSGTSATKTATKRDNGGDTLYSINFLSPPDSADVRLFLVYNFPLDLYNILGYSDSTGLFYILSQGTTWIPVGEIHISQIGDFAVSKYRVYSTLERLLREYSLDDDGLLRDRRLSVINREVDKATGNNLFVINDLTDLSNRAHCELFGDYFKELVPQGDDDPLLRRFRRNLEILSQRADPTLCDLARVVRNKTIMAGSKIDLLRGFEAVLDNKEDALKRALYAAPKDEDLEEALKKVREFKDLFSVYSTASITAMGHLRWGRRSRRRSKRGRYATYP